MEESNGGVEIFAVEDDSKVVGWMTLAMESWNSGLRVYEVLVYEQYREKGVGELLVNEAKQVGKRKDCRAIIWRTTSVRSNSTRSKLFNSMDVTRQLIAMMTQNKTSQN